MTSNHEFTDDELAVAAIRHIGAIPHAQRPERLATLSVPHRGDVAAATAFWREIMDFIIASDRRAIYGAEADTMAFALAAGVRAARSIDACPVLRAKVERIARQQSRDALSRSAAL